MGYFDNKDRLAKLARTRYELLENMDLPAIEDSFRRTTMCGETRLAVTQKAHNDINYIITPMLSVDAIFKYYATGYKTAVLNFASYKNPGGMYLKGSSAQEESLCHSSNLYNILMRFDASYYDWNRHHLNNSLYLNRALYTPDVKFEDNKSNFIKCDVITCAAPNISPYYKYNNRSISLSNNSDVLDSRIKFVLDVAELHKVDILILGAFGCGVFMQNPLEVATDFKKYLDNYNYSFKKVIFAIPQGNNYKAFRDTFKDSKNYTEDLK